MNIQKVILGAVGSSDVADVARGVGASTGDVGGVLRSAVPGIVGAMSARARDDKPGMEKLLGGLLSGKKSKTGGGLVDELLGGAKDKIVRDAMRKAGVSNSGVVGKIIEGLLPKIFDGLRKKGISVRQIMMILAVVGGGKKSGLGGIVGSILTGALGKSKGKKGGLAGIAGKVLGGFLGRKEVCVIL